MGWQVDGCAEHMEEHMEEHRVRALDGKHSLGQSFGFSQQNANCEKVMEFMSSFAVWF